MINPYIVIPNLIEQPTWGGDYIIRTKKITNPSIAQKRIGQSYELYHKTNLSIKHSTEHLPSLELGSSADPSRAKLLSTNDKPMSINQLIKKDAQATLGSKALKVHGKKMNILIKFTQAKGNSYQIHIKRGVKSSTWEAKPESWYYFEPGVVTLGVKQGADWRKYGQICKLINRKAIEISRKIRLGRLELTQGKNDLRQIIKSHNPEQFVNVLKIKKDQAIDLSSGGVQHSWEENHHYAPNGNIVYEVQLNVFDPVSTIRSFDKGKIKDDGSVREIHIDDYFKFIDRGKKANEPNTHFRSGRILMSSSQALVKQIFKTPDYSLQEITVSKATRNNYTTPKGTFHHLFVRKGSIDLRTVNQTWVITNGYAIFIPASTGSYTITPHKVNTAPVLKTFV